MLCLAALSVQKNKANFRRCRREVPPSAFVPPASPVVVVQTNPISPLCRSGDRRSRKGRSCETKPIWRGRRGMGAGGRETPTGSNCAKQSQFPAERREGQVPCRKGVMVNRTCNRLRQNKANSSLRIKRSSGGHRLATYGLQPLVLRVGCTNKANWREEARRAANPLLSPGRLYEEPILRNKPNFGEPGGGRGIPLFQYSIIPLFQSLPIVRNKANPERAGGRGGIGSRHRKAATPIGSEYTAGDFDLLFTICDL